MDRDNIDKLAELVKRRDLRSADRAHMETMLRRARAGQSLTYQEQQNLWAYFNRYGVPAVDARPSS